MKISKKNIIIALFLSFCFVACLIAMAQSLIVGYRESSTANASWEKRLDNLHTLLCEEIKLGMTKEQVVSILEKKGQFSTDGFYNQPDADLGVHFTDPVIFEKYGNFTVVISNNTYVESFVNSGFENYQTICSIR